jgi:hypothetical protein
MTHEAAVVLAEAYEGATTVIAGLAEVDRDRPTGCAGWSVDALVAHLLLDAQRALVALASEVQSQPDTDAVSYWRAWHPSVEPQARDSHAGFVTRLAHAYPSMESLTVQWAHTAQAAVRAAARAHPDTTVATQQHVLTVADLCRTLVVEAVVHHLDLVAHLPEAPDPAAEPRAIGRQTLDALWGRTAPAGWDDAAYLRKATGREKLTDADRGSLGASAARLPLLG